MLNIAASRDWDVINPGGLFLFLFWASKKEKLNQQRATRNNKLHM
jgi:hypothetical protein